MTTTSTELDQIRALIDDVAAGVTARDADRCVARFAADAVSVVTTGARARGRDAIYQAHLEAFALGGPPAAVRFVVLDAAFPRPDVAVVTTGAYRAAPTDDVDLEHPSTIVTWTLIREPDGWWIVARQFTAVAPS
jgi:uncharacterized protein (TIGR02246 family)